LGYILGGAGPGSEAEAREKLQQAWELAHSIDAKPVAVNTLVGFAMLLASEQAEQSELEYAVELATVALKHPAADQETRDRAKRLLDRLATKLSSASMDAARERGAAGKLDTVDPLRVTD
jgi:hypothetical protein